MPRAKKAATPEKPAAKPELSLKIKAVGGLYNGEYVGWVRDTKAALCLLHLIKLTGGHACWLSGMGVLKDGIHQELSLDEATKILFRSRILQSYSPAERKKLELTGKENKIAT